MLSRPLDNDREKFPVLVSRGILLAGFALLLALNWPGQMSYDSVVQLADGRSGQYDSWHPPVMAWLLGLFDSLLPGTGLYLVFTGFLLLGGWFVLMRQGRPGLGTALLLLLIFATPQLVLYQGTIWKDVLFADAGIAGFACLAASAACWQNPATRLTYVILAAMLLSLAELARQNGFLLLPVAALCLGLVAAKMQSRSAGWRYGLGLLAASLALAAMGNLGLSIRSDKGEGAAEQIRLAQVYDLVGAVHQDPAVRFKLLEQKAPRLNAAIRKDGVALYSPHLVDTLENSSTLTQAIHDAPPGLIFAQWRDLILEHPALYLRQRLPVFGWLVAPPDPLLCHPDVVGIDGPPDLLRQLGLKPRIRPQDRVLYSYVAQFFHTPVLSHLLYGALAFVFLMLLARRGSPADLVVAGLQVAALVFALSFFVISIACDYRYLYFLDLAAMTGSLQLSWGGPIFRSGRGSAHSPGAQSETESA
jgi:hypothetical protein